MTGTEFAFISSRLIRQVAAMGGDVSALVPPQVLPHLGRKGTQADTDDALEEAE